MKYLDFLQTVPLFSGISADELQALLSETNAQFRSYAVGETILFTGATTERFGILTSGKIQIVKEDFDGNQTLVAQLTPGHIFAEAFACTQKPLTVAVQAETPAEILWMGYTALCLPSGGQSTVRQQVVRRLTESFAAKNLFLQERIGHLAKRSLREKALSYLSEQAVKTGSRSFTIPFDRRQMADYLAADRSALSAVLGKLRKEGVLRFHKNHFTFL
jgi:CRP-like cAMP-binding protein